MAPHEQVHRPKHHLGEREAGGIVGRNGGRERDRQTEIERDTERGRKAETKIGDRDLAGVRI